MIERLKSDLSKNFANERGIYTPSDHKIIDNDSNRKIDSKSLAELKISDYDEYIKSGNQNNRHAIFNPNRCVGLKLLEIKSGDIGIIYGCSVGNLLMYAAKNCEVMVAVEENIQNLRFIQRRLENASNTLLINSKIQNDLFLRNHFDFAIINGTFSQVSSKPLKFGQSKFLKRVRSGLKKEGKLFFAVKNRLSPQYYLTSQLPFHADQHLYSYSEYLNLLNKAGFSKIQTHFVFPDYNFPLKILPLRKGSKSSYAPVSHRQIQKNFFEKVLRKINTKIDFLVFKKLKLFKFSPSFIFIAISEIKTINR